MRTISLSQKIKIALMAVTVLSVAIMGLVGGVSWAGVALANDDPGTVPVEPQAFVAGPFVEELPEPAPGECGPGLVSDSTPAFVGDSLLRVLEVQPGTSQLGSSLGVASFTADTVAPEVLPASPLGYERLSCGILTSGQSTLGGPVAIFRRGPVTCFSFPAEALENYQLWIFYYDPTPGIQRWVRLVTIVDPDTLEACTSLRLPALLALFGLPR